jgi:spore coat protein U-like protein
MKASTTIKVVSAAALLAGAAAASAATANGTLNVSATVNATCFVDSAGPLNFSSYNPSLGQQTGNSSVTVRCTNGTQFDIGLDAGKGTGATEASRVMASGSNTLAYSLYQDSALSNVWGNTVGTNTVRDTGIGLGSGKAITKTVYGKIPDQPNAVPGSYTDQVTVTVTY